MKNELLWTALADLDPELIEAAETAKHRRRLPQKLLIVAATICLLVGSVWAAGEISRLRIQPKTHADSVTGFSVNADVKRFPLSAFGAEAQALMADLSEENPTVSRNYRSLEEAEAVLGMELPENSVLDVAQHYFLYRDSYDASPFVGGGDAGNRYPFNLYFTTNLEGEPITADLYGQYLMDSVRVSVDIRYFTEHADFLSEEDSAAMGHYWSGAEVALTEETYTLSDGTEVTIVETLATQQSAHTHTSETTTFHAYFIRDGVLFNVDTYGWEDDSPQKEVLLKVLDGYSE